MCMIERWLPALLAVSLFAAPQTRAQSDSCGSATLIGVGTFSGNTSAATNDGAACAESETSADVWFRFTAAESCQLVLDTCGSDFDTVLSVHTGCPGTAANMLACDDDNSCGTASRVSLGVVAGNDYLVRIGGWRGAVGTFELQVGCTDPGGQHNTG